MPAKIDLKNLTAKQRNVWRMRYRKGWRMSEIAAAMGTSPSGVSRLLQRAHISAGLPVCRVSIIKTKPRTIRSFQLSEVFEAF